MIELLIAASLMGSPNPGDQIPSCYDRPNVRCADPSPKNGIRVDGVIVQACSRHHGAVCFTWQWEGLVVDQTPQGNVIKSGVQVYTIHAG